MPRFNHGVQHDTGALNPWNNSLQAAFGQWETVNHNTSAGPHYYSNGSPVSCSVPRLPYYSVYGVPYTPYFSPSAHHVEDDDFSGNRSQWVPIPSASTTNIYISSFFVAQGLGVKPIQRRREIGLDILCRTYSLDTLGASTPSCHPGTRREALKYLYGWASETASATSSILWLHGPTGVGKSAILGTLTQRLRATGRLVGSFVFSPQHSPRKNANALFCIIAYQLAINAPCLRASISRAVRKNPGIVGETMNVQLQELILGPCRDVMLLHPLVLVIDSLDEFAYDVQREILTLLGNTIQTQPFPLRIIVASRSSEHHIAKILAEPCFNSLWRSLNVEGSLEDVRTYLWVELGRIQEERSLEFGAVPWFSTRVLDALVEASSGCFLYASTFIRFLGDVDFSPAKRLAAIEAFPPSHLHSSIDTLYIQILAAVPLASRPSLLSLLRILTTDKFAGLPIYHIEQLLHMKAGRLRRILHHLRAVLDVVPASESGRIMVHHASFLDFLGDPARSGAFCVSGAERSMHLARCVLRSLAYAHQNPRVNRVEHVAWNHLAAMVDYVTSVYPSSDFLHLVRCINPDFFFGSLSTFEQVGSKMLAWLNKMHPRPVEEIRVWEDYVYMSFFHSTVNDFDFDEEPDMHMFSGDSKSELGAQRQQILLRHPALIRLLRFSMVLPALTPLFQFRVLLGASWDDLRSVICALRPIFRRDDAALIQLWRSLQDPEFAREIYPWSSVFQDLALQSIRVVKAVYSGALPMEAMGYWLEWGRYVRSSPPSTELLREVVSFVPRADDSESGIATESEVYDMLKWFESFPDVPRTETLRWARYLPDGTEFDRECAYEARWTSWSGLAWYDA